MEDGNSKLSRDEADLLRLFRSLDTEGQQEVFEAVGRRAVGAILGEDQRVSADHWWLYRWMPDTDWMELVKMRAEDLEDIEAVIGHGLTDSWLTSLFGPRGRDDEMADGLQEGLEYFAERHDDLLGCEPRLKEFPVDELKGFVREWRERVIRKIETKPKED